MRALGLTLFTALFGVTLPVDYVAIQEALTIANSSFEAEHRRFHAEYHLPVNSPPVDFMSIVTPFRRIVLTSETDARLGRRRFGQKEALGALQPYPDQIEIYAELTFHPHNTFLGVPNYTIELQAASRGASVILPREVERLPRFGSRIESPWYPYSYPFREAPGLPSRTDTLLGGTLIARVPGSSVDPKGRYDVMVKDGTRELARARAELERLR
jgi:hypothetical protein